MYSAEKFCPPKTFFGDKRNDNFLHLIYLFSHPQEMMGPDDVKYHHNGRRVRTVFTRHQLITLNSIFKKQNFISSKRMRELSDELGLDRKTVKIWFQVCEFNFLLFFFTTFLNVDHN